ncbi:terpenoid synthase [Aspergillus aurantiobrunneus]
MPQTHPSITEFRQSIRGQTATLPNLYALFPEWKPRLHAEYERARDEVLNPWIERWVPNAASKHKFQKADFSRFAAIMCADASFEKLCTVAKAFAWAVFDCGCLTDDRETIREYREKTLQYFGAVLCGKGEFPDLSGFSEELQNALLCWDEVAAHIRHHCSRASRRTAGVYPVIATIPFIYGIDVSKQELANDLMELLWRHTSYLVHIQIDNLVTVLMLNVGTDYNKAMQLSTILVQEVGRGFHEVEDNLQGLSDHARNKVSEMFLQGCKNVVMGLTYWSYVGQRYFEASEISEENEITFVI